MEKALTSASEADRDARLASVTWPACPEVKPCAPQANPTTAAKPALAPSRLRAPRSRSRARRRAGEPCRKRRGAPCRKRRGDLRLAAGGGKPGIVDAETGGVAAGSGIGPGGETSRGGAVAAPLPGGAVVGGAVVAPLPLPAGLPGMATGSCRASAPSPQKSTALVGWSSAVGAVLPAAPPERFMGTSSPTLLSHWLKVGGEDRSLPAPPIAPPPRSPPPRSPPPRSAP